ncbi:MAGEB4 isoform 1 [Pan troglodytes]|uniref:MAGE family member B4 n=2 Tax=Pan troglodytes TaxID=9598 RepID=G2HHF1_PANTR|nr:melanoma-associated antigen B4 [Pan troglodytes]PNI41771.1 MAGEB4 isoform 1 [Pan troglodytes]BAK63159.1 melanoma-associated antigen B4 [Pan troglodytes]
MPRGQKSKLRAREKRQRTRGQTQDLKVGQPTAAEKEESPSSSSSVLRDTASSSLAFGIPQEPQREPPTTSAAAAMSCTGSDEGDKSQDEENASSSQASTSTERSLKDSLTRKTKMLVQFLLYKYKMKEPTTKAEMLKIISKKYKEHFPEIFRKVSQRTELVFGLALKEVNPTTHSYILVSMLGPNDGNQSSAWTLPRNGLLMPLLSVIFLNGNCAREEEIWEFLNMLGIYDGKRHLIFGEPRKLITQDLVQEKYLEYQQVPNSDPPRYQFLWGPRAHAETSKMKVLEFLAKVNDTTPNNFPLLYEEALRDEEERAGAWPRVAARRGTIAMTSAYSRATSSSSSHPM